MLRSLVPSWLLSSSAPARARSTRSIVESVPPSSAERSWSSRISGWLRASGWRGDRGAEPWSFDRSGDAIAAARLDFADALFDLRGDAVADTLDRIAELRRLDELWHLRAEVFGRVAERHGQAEAKRRLALLDLHFPTRERPSPGRRSRRAAGRR